jgi:ubiquinone/menaquinone biosynthesis C-methylase UbiE
VGLNIDQRQIDRARKNVKAKKENIIEFVKGNASQLPFEENSFDVVLAVECIFHFPDRNEFFNEVQRVLRPGGYFALSDFIISYELPPMLRSFSKGPGIPFYGNIQLCNIERYKALAEKSGFEIEEIQEITKNVLPTYPVVKKIFLKNKVGFLLTLIAQITQLIKLIRYKNISFKKK